MSDKPILFSGSMVRALLDGTKTQTRRLLKPQPSNYQGNPTPPAGKSWTSKLRDEPYFAMHDDQVHWCWWDEYNRQGPDWIKVRFAKGDRLYVRETWTLHDRAGDVGTVAYQATFKTHGWTETIEQFPRDLTLATRVQPVQRGWRPSIHMPRWASRLMLTVTDVRVERLQDCSIRDAIAEGISGNEMEGWRCYLPEPKPQNSWADPRESYRTLWDAINGPGAWEANPWIVAISFTVHRGNIDAMRAT